MAKYRATMEARAAEAAKRDKAIADLWEQIIPYADEAEALGWQLQVFSSIDAPDTLTISAWRTTPREFAKALRHGFKAGTPRYIGGTVAEIMDKIRAHEAKE